MDTEKFNLWPRHYHDYLFGYAKYKLEDKELIEDLIQDTFLYAFEHMEQFGNRSSEITWLTAILKYKIYKVYRVRSSKRLLYLNNTTLQYVSFNANGLPAANFASIPDLLVNKEFLLTLNKFVCTLPNQWKQLYKLKYEYNEKTKTICRELNLTPGNYWVMNHRLKLSLKNWYLKNWKSQ